MNLQGSVYQGEEHLGMGTVGIEKHICVLKT